MSSFKKLFAVFVLPFLVVCLFEVPNVLAGGYSGSGSTGGSTGGGSSGGSGGTGSLLDIIAVIQVTLKGLGPLLENLLKAVQGLLSNLLVSVNATVNAAL